MPKRKFTEEELEELGWAFVDRMLQPVRPQPPQQVDPIQRLKEAAQGWNQGNRVPKPRIPKIGGV